VVASLLAEQAPSINLHVRQVSVEDTPEMLAQGSIDVAIGLPQQIGQSLYMQTLLTDAQAMHEGERSALMDVDHTCHAIFWEAADNPFLEDSLTVLYAWSQRLWHFALPAVPNLRGAVLEHQAMLDAVRAGETEVASQLMQEHIRGFQANIQDAILHKLASPGMVVEFHKQELEHEVDGENQP
jgi:DNA-binding transcriptional LysR family regulator